MISTAIFQKQKLQLWRKRKNQKLLNKKISRKRLKSDQSKRLGFIKKNVDITLTVKLQKKTDFEKKQTKRNFMKM